MTEDMPIKLMQLLPSRFNSEEIKSICFNLDVDYEGLDGENKVSKIRELISHLNRREKLDLLVSEVCNQRSALKDLLFSNKVRQINTTDSVTKQGSSVEDVVDTHRPKPARHTVQPTLTEVDFPNSDMAQRAQSLENELKASHRRRFAFLLIGRTGVGKSSTINSLLGGKYAKPGKWKPVTKKVSRFYGKTEGINFSIIDTPGLADSEDESYDENYLRLIKNKVRRIDLMWFVTTLDEDRIRKDEMSTIRIVTEVFGEEIWNRALIIFTKADKIDAEDFEEALFERTKQLRKEIAKHTSTLDCQDIPSVPIANNPKSIKPLNLPNGENWLGNLYLTILNRISSEKAVWFHLAVRKRIRIKEESRNQLSEKETRPNDSEKVGYIEINKEQKKKSENILQKGLTSFGSLLKKVYGEGMSEEVIWDLMENP